MSGAGKPPLGGCGGGALPPGRFGIAGALRFWLGAGGGTLPIAGFGGGGPPLPRPAPGLGGLTLQRNDY